MHQRDRNHSEERYPSNNSSDFPTSPRIDRNMKVNENGTRRTVGVGVEVAHGDGGVNGDGNGVAHPVSSARP